jgi:hypothetical protein
MITIEFDKPKAPPTEEERAWGYYIRTGDPTFLNDISKKKQDSARYSQVWD